MKPRSMEEKISYLLFLMGFAGLLCTAALCIFVFHKAFRAQAWTALEREADLVAAGCTQVDDPSQLKAYVDGSLRITLIASDGSVLFESATDQPMENHLRRPEIQQAMNLGCEALKFFPAEANGGVGMLKNIGAALKGARWMCTGGVNAKNVNDYLGYDQIFAVGGTWMCKSDVIKAGDWAKITAQSKEAVDTMLGLHLIHVGINTGNEEEAAKVAGLISTMLNMKVAPGNSSIFVGNKEFEIMKKPGRGTNGHIAIGCNNVDRAIYHLSQRGVKFDLDSKNVKNGKTVACYMEGEIAGFAFHLVQA